MKSTTATFTREQLYKALWEQPARTLAMMLGISDVDLLKVCRKFNIPKPGPGYWHLLKLGKAEPKPELPTAPSEVPETIVIPQPKEPKKKSNDIKPIISNEEESVKKAEGKIQIADDFRSAHPLVRDAKRILEKGQVDQIGRVHGDYTEKHISVRVSKASLRRALLIMDAIIQAVEKQGHKTAIDSGKGTYFTIGGIEVRFSLQEKSDRKERPLSEKEKTSSYIFDRWQYTCTGKLVFKIEEYHPEGIRKTWSDGLRATLEDWLDEILESVFTVAEGIKAVQIKREEESRCWALERAQQEEIRRQKAEDEAKKKLLEEQAQQWVKCKNMNNFVDICAEELGKYGEITPDSPAGQWLQWARDHIRSIDPLQNGYLWPLGKRHADFKKQGQDQMGLVPSSPKDARLSSRSIRTRSVDESVKEPCSFFLK